VIRQLRGPISGQESLLRSAMLSIQWVIEPAAWAGT
jgi:hypothetical protein